MSCFVNSIKLMSLTLESGTARILEPASPNRSSLAGSFDYASLLKESKQDKTEYSLGLAFISNVIPGLSTDAFFVNTKSDSVFDGVIKSDDVSNIVISVQNSLSVATMINSESSPAENQNLSQIDIHVEEIPKESTFEIVGDLPSEPASNLPTMESVEALPTDYASTSKVLDAQNSVLTTLVSDNP
ncbi:hypothetical protein FEM48_Zijuj07G0082900 [Ziziphus jujuba var. spinosa]|uniref:Uncharacterized protein n=1 Tax=Ziziphus jujuba var. spinosa TaxID=714518 RepID=A0A978V3I5_ZIZJJ|nr:hypothetical protein FEM48_Zijuj07G0082900 [Ziziphus jujuba var. spinosa]